MNTSRRGVPAPQLIGIVFASLWGVLGALSLPATWHVPGFALSAVTGIVCAAVALRLGSSARVPLFSRSSYRIAVIAEILAIMFASYVLGRLGLSAWFLQAVGVAVGLHFIGLAKASGDRRYLFLSVAITLVSVIAIFLPRMFGAIRLADAFTGWGNAIVIWTITMLPSLAQRPPANLGDK